MAKPGHPTLPGFSDIASQQDKASRPYEQQRQTGNTVGTGKEEKKGYDNTCKGCCWK
jgi:hypothetical protein